MGVPGKCLSVVSPEFRRFGMIFVIPMAGESRRFRDAGYATPKYQLEAFGAPLFDHAVSSFSKYFQSDAFLFVVRGDEAAKFVCRRCCSLSIRRAEVVTLHASTAGQADTVLRGLDKADINDERPVAVFNIDTFRPGYCKPSWTDDPNVGGYIEAFHGIGSHWSFVACDGQEPRVATATAEKSPISSLCCTGLYYFRRAGDFRWAYGQPTVARSEAERRERYVAPLYNALIARGDRIGVEVIPADEVIFSGTPEEYRQALMSPDTGRRLLT